MIDSIRNAEKNVLLLDSGDILNIWDNSHLHRYIIRAYKILEYDAWMAGDQDFVEGMNFFFDYLLREKMQLVNTNISLKGELLGNKYLIKNINGIKIGITGTIDHSLHKYISEYSRGYIEFNDQKNALKPVLKEMSSLCDYIILLSHSGMDKDEKIAEIFPEIDLIVGGHSQTITDVPEKKGETLIVQAGEHGYRLGLLTLKFTGKKLQSYQNNLVLLKLNRPDHPEIKQLINEYYNERKQ